MKKIFSINILSYSLLFLALACFTDVRELCGKEKEHFTEGVL